MAAIMTPQAARNGKNGMAGMITAAAAAWPRVADAATGATEVGCMPGMLAMSSWPPDFMPGISAIAPAALVGCAAGALVAAAFGILAISDMAAMLADCCT